MTSWGTHMQDQYDAASKEAVHIAKEFGEARPDLLRMEYSMDEPGKGGGNLPGRLRNRVEAILDLSCNGPYTFICPEVASGPKPIFIRFDEPHILRCQACYEAHLQESELCVCRCGICDDPDADHFHGAMFVYDIYTFTGNICCACMQTTGTECKPDPSQPKMRPDGTY